MRPLAAVAGLLLAGTIGAAAVAAEPVTLASPGFPPSQMDAQGRLVEDWGPLGVKLGGEGVTDGPVQVEAVKLDGLIPAARATSNRGAVKMIATAYRAPAHPAGVDVLVVRLEEARGQPAKVSVALDLPEKAKIGLRSVKLGSRAVVTLPERTIPEDELRDWGYCDEGTSLPRWAKPQGACDPAFGNIRAGMGGMPLVYRFKVAPKSVCDVVLGFCESHWAESGQRPLACRVEGAEPQQIDPIAKWGRHKPGALLFAARDDNGDGRLEISVRAAPGAKDRNPILNAIWIFPKGKSPGLEKVISGATSEAALFYVDVGGQRDQSIFPPGKAEYRVSLPAGGAQELTFLGACPGGSAPSPETSVWTADTLRRAACDVWRDWPDGK